MLQIDIALRRVDEFAPDDLRDRLTVKSRSGTDFRIGFRWFEQQGIRLVCWLYFPDMQCDRYPDTQPDVAAIWIEAGDRPSDWNRKPWRERNDLRLPAPAASTVQTAGILGATGSWCAFAKSSVPGRVLTSSSAT